MVTMADVDVLRELTDQVAQRAAVDVEFLVQQILYGAESSPEAQAALRDLYPRLLASAETDAEALTALYWEDVYGMSAHLPDPEPLLRAEKAVDHTTRTLWTPDGPIPEDAVEAMARELVRKTDRYLRQSVGKTMVTSASRNRLLYARVPNLTGGSCAFCLMLASRGTDYASTRTGAGKLADETRFHDHCRCAVVAIRDPSELPDGYDPDALHRELYAPAVAHAVSQYGPKPTPHQIMASMRATGDPDLLRDSHVEKKD